MKIEPEPYDVFGMKTNNTPKPLMKPKINQK